MELVEGDSPKGPMGFDDAWKIASQIAAALEYAASEAEDYPPAVNVLSEEKNQQVLALGRLGWSLRRIERTIHIRRETAATYLKAAGIPVRPPGGWGRGHPKPAIGCPPSPDT